MDYQRLVSIVSAGAATVSLLFYGANYRTLPDSVPVSFSIKGEINRYGPPITYPIITIACYLIFQWARSSPSSSNFIVKLTPANTATQFELVRRLMTDLLWIVPVITGIQIGTAYRNPPTVPWYVATGMTIGIIGRIGVYFYSSWKAQ